MATPAMKTETVEEYQIEFLRDYFVKDGTGTKYRKGQKVTMSKASCEHFVRREAAAYVGAKPKEEKKEPDINLADLATQQRELDQRA